MLEVTQVTSPYDSLVKTGSLAARKFGEMNIQLASLCSDEGSDEEVINGCGICWGTLLATATNSTGNPAASPGDPATSYSYQKSPDLSIIK